MRWVDSSSRKFGIFIGFAVALFGLLIGIVSHSIEVIFAGCAAGFVIFIVMGEKARSRARILRKEFPGEWKEILRDYVNFYNQLDDERKKEFEQGVQIFLEEVKFHAVGGAELNDEIKVLTAATAVMLVFNRREWDLPRVKNVVIRPGTFKVPHDEDEDDDAAGLHFDNTIVISQEDFYRSFQRGEDGYNVIVHELAHAIDSETGAVDGIPSFLNPNLVKPWSDLIRHELEKNRKGGGILDRYAGTNEAELFAVAVETFVEKPEYLKKNHPELYRYLEDYFGGTMVIGPLKLRPINRQNLGRNLACRCGSGKKYKDCCLGKANRS